jgi:hypothetical protein
MNNTLDDQTTNDSIEAQTPGGSGLGELPCSTIPTPRTDLFFNDHYNGVSHYGRPGYEHACQLERENAEMRKLLFRFSCNTAYAKDAHDYLSNVASEPQREEKP